MNTAADARCPRCGAGFHCGVRDTTPRPCGTVDLSAEILQLLRERYTACLCLPCLREVAAMPVSAALADTKSADMKKPARP